MSAPTLEIATITRPATQRSDGWLLYHGIRNLQRCDEAEVVAGIAHYIIRQYGGLRFGAPLMERTRNTFIPAVFALLGWMRAFLTVRRPASPNGAIWIARLSNERKAIQPFVNQAPDLNWTELKYNHWPDTDGAWELFGARRKRTTARRILGIARRLHRRQEFFKVLRVIELIAYYARYQRIFAEGNYTVAVTSSHSNPHAIAFNLAARKFGVPVVLITHGMPVPPVARLTYDLALVHCMAAQQTYRSEGCVINENFVHGRAQEFRSMPSLLPERVSVGVFLCKDVNEQRFRSLVRSLLDNPAVSRVLVRPHPKNLWRQLPSWLDSLNDLRVAVSSAKSLFEDLQSVNVVLGGNSSVLIDAVVAGRPAAYVADLDYGPQDLHRLVERGLVCVFKDKHFALKELLQFYQTAAWRRTLRLFANVDESDAAITAEVTERLRLLAGESTEDQRVSERQDDRITGLQTYHS